MESGSEITTNAFWKKEGLRHIKPNTGKEFPEGFNVLGYLEKWANGRRVVEIGCGYGRLCGAFPVDEYIGYDINPQAVEKAKRMFPDYPFFPLEDSVLFPSDLVMFYTVLLHIPDESIIDFIKSVTGFAPNVLVAEVMGRKWRRQGNPPVFNREPAEYDEIFKEAGFLPIKRQALPYKRYKNTDITFIEYERY